MEDRIDWPTIQIWPSFKVTASDPKAFVQCWHPLYDFFTYDESFYQDNIRKPLDDDLIGRWFEWKNGGRLSAKKAESVRTNYTSQKLAPVNLEAQALSAFLKEEGGVIWRIFWLHIQQPLKFPIYDRHAHRAIVFLMKLPVVHSEISEKDREKIAFYLDHYRPVLMNHFVDMEPRHVDRALWTFGKYLSTRQRLFLTDANQNGASPT